MERRSRNTLIIIIVIIKIYPAVSSTLAVVGGALFLQIETPGAAGRDQSAMAAEEYIMMVTWPCERVTWVNT